MFSPISVLLAVLSYMALIFALAQWVEHRISVGRSRFNSPWVYALSQAVFFTSWTFFGSVGFAVEYGLQFFGIYIGAMLGMALSGFTFMRMVRAKEAFRITSIADFLSIRYRHSQKIASLVTLIALIGLIPYIALQLKAIIDSLSVITSNAQRETDWNLAGTLVTGLMVIFTIVFGVRRLDPTERHQGIVAALVAECIVKLLAFIAIGLFVAYILFDGPTDIAYQLREQNLDHLLSLTHSPNPGISWFTLILLGFAAIHCLPRQFHVAVVENSSKHHLRILPWSFPLYTVLISMFVVPIAAAGLLLGLPGDSGDQFMLLLPQLADSPTFTLIAFLGGYAAATGMILITTMALATMASNHLVLPLCEKIRTLSSLRSYLLQIRWVLVLAILSLAYATARALSDSYILVSIGLISFAAVLQFVPAMLLGMFWRRGSSLGAFWGLMTGFAVWFYTLLVPAFIEEGWISNQLMLHGPFGIQDLRPEQLLGLGDLSPLSHSVFWSLGLNLVVYILLSLALKASKKERRLARELFNCMRGNPLLNRARPTGLDPYISFGPKLEEARQILNRYLPDGKVESSLSQLTDDLQVSGKHQITVIELMEFHRMLEHFLSGSIGAAAAHGAISDEIHYTDRESTDLKALYSHLVSEIRPTMAPDQENDSDGYSLLVELQQQVEALQRQKDQQQEKFDQMEKRLETQYEKNFNLRISEQRLKQENEVLREQLRKMETDS
ncbi:sodium:solute symporter family transporter [Marinobacterium mangrovicola]|uniref:Na+/proline symporter n=1 Tax=Marinobacterium mangrovicola TaxID=1476959 RepID=A0A4R1GME9_9GAMM|nr:sodium:solute symporter [Marinobacterium mangrovicola]TCK09568.1 Na+/proline symporter [Marinobacterium mangrovicola]